MLSRGIGLRNFWADESGQSLLVGVFTLFALAVMSLVIVGIGEATTCQMRLQNAADAAAYSGAQIQADCVAQIAWLNEGMAAIYYHTMRFAVDNATYAVLAELKEIEPFWDPGEDISPPDEIIGVNNVVGRWQVAYDAAREWIPRGEKWLLRLSQLARTIACVAPTLVEHQVFFTAKENGSERTCFYPGFEFLPEGPARLTLEMQKIGEPNIYPNGWSAWSEEQDFRLEATHSQHADPEAISDEEWERIDWHDIWDLTMRRGDETASLQVRSRFERRGQGRPAFYHFHAERADGSIDDRTVAVDANGKCLVSGSGGMVSVALTRTPTSGSWTDIEYPDGKKLSLKYDDQGYLCTWTDKDKDGEKDADEWTRASDKTSVNINGVEVPFDFNPHIQIDDDISMRITEPIHLYLMGLEVILTNPVRIRYHTGIGAPGHLEVKDDVAVHNGLSTQTPSRRWLRNFHAWQQRDHDRVRHRLYQESDDLWRYEWVRVGAYMEDMPMLKFGAHAIMDHDAGYINRAGAERWLLPGEADSAAWEDSGSLSTSKWRYYPEWAQPPRPADPTEDDPEDREFGGWFDIAAGAPAEAAPPGLPPFGSAYSQSRICWYCANKGNVPGDLWDVNERSGRYYLDNDHKKCARPCGFWHETYSLPSDWNQRRQELDERGAAYVALTPDDERNPYRGVFLLQVYCPLTCSHVFSAPPKTYGEDLFATPTRVRRSLYHAFGRHDKASRPREATARRMDQAYDPVLNPLARDFYAIKFGGNTPESFRPPLQLTSEMFRNSITVVTFAPWVGDWVGRLIGMENPSEAAREMGFFNPLHPDYEARGAKMSEKMWGHFAIATARLFWVDPEAGAASGEVELRTRFSWDGPPIPEETEPLDPIGREWNWDRERWVRGAWNLFEPGWCAALTPVRTAVDARDYYTAEELADLSLRDTNTSLLLRILRSAYWRKNVTDSGYGWHNTDTGRQGPTRGWDAMTAPPMQGEHQGAPVDWSDPDIEQVLVH